MDIYWLLNRKDVHPFEAPQIPQGWYQHYDLYRHQEAALAQSNISGPRPSTRVTDPPEQCSHYSGGARTPNANLNAAHPRETPVKTSEHRHQSAPWAGPTVILPPLPQTHAPDTWAHRQAADNFTLTLHTLNQPMTTRPADTFFPAPPPPLTPGATPIVGQTNPTNIATGPHRPAAAAAPRCLRICCSGNAVLPSQQYYPPTGHYATTNRDWAPVMLHNTFERLPGQCTFIPWQPKPSRPDSDVTMADG